MGLLAAAAPIFGVIGTGISAIGAFEQGQTEAAMARYQAQVANNNAIAAQQSATAAQEAGEAQAENASLQNRQAVAAIAAEQGASGIDPNTGSAKQTQETQRLVGRTNAATVMQQGEVQGYEYEVAGTNQQAQAGLYSAEASADEQAGMWGAMGSLMGGLSNVGAKYSWMTTVGAAPAGGGFFSPFMPTGSPNVGNQDFSGGP